MPRPGTTPARVRARGRTARGQRTRPLRLGGFTLVELMVSTSIAALLAGAAYPGLHALWQRREVIHAADRLAASVEMARAVAIARRQTVSIVPLSPGSGYTGGWRVMVEDGKDGGATTLSVVRPRPGCLRIERADGSGAGRPLRLAPVGYSRIEGGGFLAATFSLRCGGAIRQVRFGALGRLRLCTPGRDAGCNDADRDEP